MEQSATARQEQEWKLPAVHTAEPDQELLDESVRKTKALQAEEGISLIRLALIFFNVVVYLAFIDVPWQQEIAASFVSVIALMYALFVVLYRPQIKWAVMQSAAFTAATDSALIVAWLMATGGAASPFYPLWFASLIAIAFRFTSPALIVATCVYMGLDIGVQVASSGWVLGAESVVRVAYIGFSGALLVSVSMATRRAVSARLSVERAVIEERAQADEQHRIEQHQQEVDRLQSMDRFRADFLNNAAHELNTPLTPLRLHLAVLRRSKNQDSIDILERNLTRLEGVVEDLLDVARAEGAQFNIAEEPVDVQSVVESEVRTYQASLDAASLTLTVESEGGPAVALADAKRVHQILSNLLTNAIKYADGSPIKIRICNEDVIRVEVHDEGIGLTPEQTELLFQPFSRAHEFNEPGTGLGLYICKVFVERMGGEIHVASEGQGKGSKFWFTLPKAPNAS